MKAAFVVKLHKPRGKPCNCDRKGERPSSKNLATSCKSNATALSDEHTKNIVRTLLRCRKIPLSKAQRVLHGCKMVFAQLSMCQYILCRSDKGLKTYEQGNENGLGWIQTQHIPLIHRNWKGQLEIQAAILNNIDFEVWSSHRSKTLDYMTNPP